MDCLYDSSSTGKARDKKEAKGSGYVPLPFLKQFYRDAYRRIRVYLPVDKTIVFHDGFRLSCWGDFFVREHMENVIVDTHMYLFAMENFVPVRAMWVYKIFMAYNRWAHKRMAKHTPVVVGEWCLEQRWALAAAEKKGKDPLQYRNWRERGIKRLPACSWMCGRNLPDGFTGAISCTGIPWSRSMRKMIWMGGHFPGCGSMDGGLNNRKNQRFRRYSPGVHP